MGIRYANSIRNKVTIGGEEYTVELVEVDNKSDKTEAVSAAQSLVSKNVSVVLGSYGSGVSIAAGQILPTHRLRQSAAPALIRRLPRATNITSAFASLILSRAR